MSFLLFCVSFLYFLCSLVVFLLLLLQISFLESPLYDSVVFLPASLLQCFNFILNILYFFLYFLPLLSYLFLFGYLTLFTLSFGWSFPCILCIFPQCLFPLGLQFLLAVYLLYIPREKLQYFECIFCFCDFGIFDEIPLFTLITTYYFITFITDYFLAHVTV